MTQIQGETAFVTGASSGIGEAIAYELARRGATAVGLFARREAELERVAARVRDLGSDPVVLPGDVTSLRAVAEAASKLQATHGFVSLVFANAGIGDLVPAARFSSRVAREIMETNYFGVVHVLEAFLPAMLEHRRGHVTATSSVAAYRGIPGLAPYSASKAAVDRLAEGLRVELAPRGIGFTVVEPGFVRTPMVARNPFPMPFIVEPEDAARWILDAVARDARRVTFPLPVALGMRLAGMIPDALYDALLRPIVKIGVRRARSAGKPKT